MREISIRIGRFSLAVKNKSKKVGSYQEPYLPDLDEIMIMSKLGR